MTPKLPITWLLAGSALAAPAAAYDLLQAWHAARQFDTGLAAAAGELRAGRELAVQGRAQWLPRVSLSGDYSHSHPIARPPDGQPTAGGETHGYGVTLSQPLFDSGRRAQWQRGRIAAETARTAHENASQQLMLDVAAAYFNVLLAKDTLAATAAAKQAYHSQLRQAQAEFELGTATITDANEARAGYDSAEADEIQAHSDLETARHALARLTGLTGDRLSPLAGDFPLTPPEPDAPAAWIDLALRQNLAIRAAGQALRQAEVALQEKRGARLPTVSLSAAYRDTVSNDPAVGQPGTRRNRGTALGVTLSMPLFAGGGLDSQISEAAARRDSARDRLEDARRRAREDVLRAWQGVTSGAAYVRAQQQRLRSAGSKLESTRLGREVGVRTNLDLLKAQQDYTDVQKNLASARYRYLNARLKLARAAGTLDPDTLADINQVLAR